MKILLVLVSVFAFIAFVQSQETKFKKKMDDDYSDDQSLEDVDNQDENEKHDHTSRRGYSIPTSRLRIEASHTTTSKKQLVPKGRMFFPMPGMDILGAMMHPMLMMLGMASFVSMMPTVVQNVGNMVPNLFPLVGNQPAAAPPAPAAGNNNKGRLLARILGWRRWRRSVDDHQREDMGPSVVRLSDDVLQLWDRFEKAIDKVGKVHSGK